MVAYIMMTIMIIIIIMMIIIGIIVLISMSHGRFGAVSSGFVFL